METGEHPRRPSPRASASASQQAPAQAGRHFILTAMSLRPTVRWTLEILGLEINRYVDKFDGGN